MKSMEKSKRIKIALLALAAVMLIVGGIFLLKSMQIPPSLPSPQPQTIDTSTWQTYRNDEFGFEVKYPTGYAIRLSPGYKLSEFSACNQTRCAMFLAIYQGPLDLSTSGPYQSYREVEAPDSLKGVFYYYSIDTRDPEIDQMLSTFRFIE